MAKDTSVQRDLVRSVVETLHLEQLEFYKPGPHLYIWQLLDLNNSIKVIENNTENLLNSTV